MVNTVFDRVLAQWIPYTHRLVGVELTGMHSPTKVHANCSSDDVKVFTRFLRVIPNT